MPLVTEVTRSDLDWWLAKADTLDWTWAKTYADTAPHHYIVEGRTPDMTHEEYIRASRVIRRFGQPGKFYSMTNIYLTDPQSQRKWWIMGTSIEDGTLINMADTDKTYGRQDAPATAPVTPSERAGIYDSIGPDYDAMWQRPSDLAENEAVRSLIARHFGAYAPTVLDVGCGTGLVLDLGITSPKLFTGIDPSQGMLNELVLKHPTVSTIIPADADTVDYSTLPDPDLVTLLFGVPSYLKPSTIGKLAAKAVSLAVFMNYNGTWLPDWYNGVPPVTRDPARTFTRSLLERFEGDAFEIGEFEVTVIRK